jgi:flagellar biosynthesis protein FlhG
MVKGKAQRKGCEIWAFGGGKGGSGKSFIASSIGTCLASRGKRVVLIDADLGGANLHSFFGISKPGNSLTDFFENKVQLDELIVNSGIPNMGLVSGNLRSLDSGGIKHTQMLKLFRHISALDTDHILIDLGGGTHCNTIDTFLIAEKMIAVVLPEITSVENLYHFMMSVMFRKLRMAAGLYGAKDIVRETWRERKEHGLKTLGDLIGYLKRVLPETGDNIQRDLAGLKLYIVLNQIRGRQDISTGVSVKSVCMKYLGFDARYAGHVEYDASVRQCINKRQVYMKAYPTSLCTKGIEMLTNNLVRDSQVKVPEA